MYICILFYCEHHAKRIGIASKGNFFCLYFFNQKEGLGSDYQARDSNVIKVVFSSVVNHYLFEALAS